MWRDSEELSEVEQDMLSATETYLAYASEDDVPNSTFLLMLIRSVIGEYQRQRNYPDGTDSKVIQADTEKYFLTRTGYVAREVIPAMLGKVGGEGLYSLVDNQVSKNWKYPFPVYLADVLPYCEVV